IIFFFFQAEDGIRDFHVTGVQTCALPIYLIENQINLFAVLNSNAVNSKTKTELLLGKLEYDQKHTTENKYLQTYGTCGFGGRPRSEERRVGKEWRTRG